MSGEQISEDDRLRSILEGASGEIRRALEESYLHDANPRYVFNAARSAQNGIGNAIAICEGVAEQDPRVVRLLEASQGFCHGAAFVANPDRIDGIRPSGRGASGDMRGASSNLAKAMRVLGGGEP